MHQPAVGHDTNPLPGGRTSSGACQVLPFQWYAKPSLSTTMHDVGEPHEIPPAPIDSFAVGAVGGRAASEPDAVQSPFRSENVSRCPSTATHAKPVLHASPSNCAAGATCPSGVTSTPLLQDRPFHSQAVEPSDATQKPGDPHDRSFSAAGPLEGPWDSLPQVLPFQTTVPGVPDAVFPTARQ